MADWETYQTAADRLGMTADAVRHRARRLAWRRTRANDGKTLIMVPTDVEPIERGDDHTTDHSMNSRFVQGSSPDYSSTIDALHDRIEGLQADLERERHERREERERSGKLAEQLIEAEKAKAVIDQARSEATKGMSVAQIEIDHLRTRIDDIQTGKVSEIAHRDAAIKELRQSLAEMRTRSWWQRLVG